MHSLMYNYVEKITYIYNIVVSTAVGLHPIKDSFGG